MNDYKSLVSAMDKHGMPNPNILKQQKESEMYAASCDSLANVCRETPTQTPCTIEILDVIERTLYDIENSIEKISNTLHGPALKNEACNGNTLQPIGSINTRLYKIADRLDHINRQTYLLSEDI